MSISFDHTLESGRFHVTFEFDGDVDNDGREQVSLVFVRALDATGVSLDLDALLDREAEKVGADFDAAGCEDALREAASEAADRWALSRGDEEMRDDSQHWARTG